jgi:hypothetical protein
VTMHLRVMAGGHDLLLAASSVLRVSDEPAGERPTLDLAQTLGGAAAGGAVILYGDEERAAIRLMVDEVKGLVDLPDERLARLPPLSPRFARLFDSIAVEAIDGHHLLRLRPRIAVDWL